MLWAIVQDIVCFRSKEVKYESSPSHQVHLLPAKISRRKKPVNIFVSKGVRNSYLHMKLIVAQSYSPVSKMFSMVNNDGSKNRIEYSNNIQMCLFLGSREFELESRSQLEFGFYQNASNRGK